MDDELLTAIAGELRAHGIYHPQAVLDVAAVAVRILGRDRCVCRQSVHLQHHETPVDRCPWCHPAKVPGRRRRRRMETVPTGDLL
ncbi:hypothetical protein [Streptomyces sp. NPDC001781]